MPMILMMKLKRSLMHRLQHLKVQLEVTVSLLFQLQLPRALPGASPTQVNKNCSISTEWYICGQLAGVLDCKNSSHGFENQFTHTIGAYFVHLNLQLMKVQTLR